MKFAHATLMVKNMEDSLKFYKEVVGLEIDKRFKAGPGVEIIFLGDGETKVELIYNEEVDEVNMGQDISLGFEVDSVDEMIKFIEDRKINIHSGPFQPNPSVRYFFVLDPNGLKIQFIEHK